MSNAGFAGLRVPLILTDDCQKDPTEVFVQRGRTEERVSTHAASTLYTGLHTCHKRFRVGCMNGSDKHRNQSAW